MQLPVIPCRGQCKPWPSIPRINWQHPLAANLTTYCYDAGGIVIDLVNSGFGTIFTSTTHLTVAPSPFGMGYRYAGTATSDFVGMKATTLNNNVTASAPFSFSCGCYPVASGASGNNIAGNGVAGGGTQCLQLIGSGTSFKFNFSNGATQLTCAAGTFSLNAFHTATAVCTASAVGALYCNGKLDQTVAATMTQNLSGQRVVFNNANCDTAHNPGGINGFIYYWAEWKRALSPPEVAQLHLDPYCFLIYPEDEMYATLVGAVAQGVSVNAQFPLWSTVSRRVFCLGDE